MLTPAQQLAEIILGESVVDWIAARRSAGQSLRRISLELRDVTDGRVDVTAETIRLWSEAAA